MEYELIRLGLEKVIGDELYSIIEGDILEEIIKESKIERVENDWKYLLEGHSFKVTPEMAPALYRLFSNTAERLEFKDPIEYYVTNSADFNASAIAGINEGTPHIINLNSRLVERLDDDELRFVAGHEIGHLISKNANITRLIQFVFPDPSRIPLIMYNKITTWRKLSELTADRFGYIASPSLEKCVSGFFKTSSGLDIKRINFRYESYLAESEKSLNYYIENNALNLSTHPINPIRLKAIELFSKSEIWAKLNNRELLTTDTKLDEQIDGLLKILMTISNDAFDHYRKQFIIAAGILMAGADKQINEDEYENILHVLAGFTIFPKTLLDSYLVEEHDILKIVCESAIKLIENNPSEKYVLLEYMINIALSDKEISPVEIGLINDFGQKVLSFSPIEIARILAAQIQLRFMPDVYGYGR